MRKRSGFTMIEILVALGIILILAGMLFFGGRAIFGKGRETATRTTLGNLANMLAELDAKTRAAGGLSAAYLNAPLTNPLVAPGNVSKDGGNPEVLQVRATIAVMAALRTMPLNRSALEQLPADQIITLAEDGSTTLEESKVPLLADAWGNPIIFVPGRVTDSMGAVLGEGGLDQVAVSGSAAPLRIESRDDRPFFASAGEDGVFGFSDVNGNGTYDSPDDGNPSDVDDIPCGDDNLYSFEN